jgi:hypothetical protein
LSHPSEATGNANLRIGALGAAHRKPVSPAWEHTLAQKGQTPALLSQGESEEEALANLKEALELYFEASQATRPPEVRMIAGPD